MTKRKRQYLQHSRPYSRSGLAEDTRLIIDEFGIGHVKLATRTKCLVEADAMSNGTVKQAKSLCKKCFGDQVKAHRPYGLIVRIARFILPV